MMGRTISDCKADDAQSDDIVFWYALLNDRPVSVVDVRMPYGSSLWGVTSNTI